MGAARHSLWEQRAKVPRVHATCHMLAHFSNYLDGARREGVWQGATELVVIQADDIRVATSQAGRHTPSQLVVTQILQLDELAQ